MKIGLVFMTLFGALTMVGVTGCSDGDDGDKAQAAIVVAREADRAEEGGSKHQTRAEVANRGWSQPKPITSEEYERRAAEQRGAQDSASQAED